MSTNHLVKIGLMGVVGRLESSTFSVYPRDAEVVCRTERGLEVGRVLTDVKASEVEHLPVRGQLLRLVGEEDQLLLSRLDRFRDRAFNACQELIVSRGFKAILVDVEHLFDGQGVFFYFLGDVEPELEALTDELLEAYEKKARFRKFTETLAQGCGPACGTSDSGCSTGACGSCSLSGGCGSKK